MKLSIRFLVAGHLRYLQSSQSSGFVNYLWWDFYRLWRSRETILCHKLLSNACISCVAQACVWDITPVWLPCKPQWWWSSDVCCHIVEKGFWGLFWKHSPEITVLHILQCMLLCVILPFFLGWQSIHLEPSCSVIHSGASEGVYSPFLS